MEFDVVSIDPQARGAPDGLSSLQKATDAFRSFDGYCTPPIWAGVKEPSFSYQYNRDVHIYIYIYIYVAETFRVVYIYMYMYIFNMYMYLNMCMYVYIYIRPIGIFDHSSHTPNN